MARNVEQLLYVIEKSEKKTTSHNMQEEGTIILKPANGTVFELVEKDGKLQSVTLNVTVKNFIADHGTGGVWGLSATGERMSVVKMH